MKLNEVKPLAPFCSQYSIRYTLNYIKVTPEYCEATDGRILVRLSRIDGSGKEDGYVPAEMFNYSVDLKVDHSELKLVPFISGEDIKWPKADDVVRMNRYRNHSAEISIHLDINYLAKIAELLNEIGVHSTKLHFGKDPGDCLYMTGTPDDESGRIVEIFLMPMVGYEGAEPIENQTAGVS